MIPPKGQNPLTLFLLVERDQDGEADTAYLVIDSLDFEIQTTTKAEK